MRVSDGEVRIRIQEKTKRTEESIKGKEEEE